MIYQQDWFMRQIEAMIQAILAVALGISANEQTATQIEDSSYGKMLEKMIDDGDICAAEDLLFNDLDQSDLSWLQIALDFYSKLNNCSDDYLAMHDFSREEIDQGLRYICTLFGYDFLVSNQSIIDYFVSYSFVFERHFFSTFDDHFVKRVYKISAVTV